MKENNKNQSLPPIHLILCDINHSGGKNMEKNHWSQTVYNKHELQWKPEQLRAARMFSTNIQWKKHNIQKRTMYNYNTKKKPAYLQENNIFFESGLTKSAKKRLLSVTNLLHVSFQNV